MSTALIYAHPYPDRSRANRALFDAASKAKGVEARSLYDLYPDYSIDVESERELLLRSEIIVWQHPMYWYSTPPLLKLWMDKVLARGFAYGEGGTFLHGKKVLWAVTTGGDEHAFSASGMHQHAFEHFLLPIRQTVEFCGMEWLEPEIVHGAHRISGTDLRSRAAGYRARMESFSATAKNLTLAKAQEGSPT